MLTYPSVPLRLRLVWITADLLDIAAQHLINLARRIDKSPF